MATFEGAAYVREQIGSILAQSHPDLELVISDDASEDGTFEVCRELADADPRIRLLPRTTEHRGLIGNFDRALSAAAGEFVAPSDQDDVWLPEKIATLLPRLAGADAPDLVFSDLIVTDESGREIAPSMTRLRRLPVDRLGSLRAVLLRNCVTGCASLFRRRLLDAVLPFPPDCLVHDWWIAVVAAAGKGVEYVDRPLVRYRQHRRNVIGAGGGGWGRVLRAVRGAGGVPAAPTPDDHLRRLEGYGTRPGVFTGDSRHDLEFALAHTRDLAGLEELPLGRRLGVLRTALRFGARRTSAERCVALFGALFPRLARRARERLAGRPD
jgi:glycosyltransferase involved in cell wall biosynthesis